MESSLTPVPFIPAVALELHNSDPIPQAVLKVAFINSPACLQLSLTIEQVCAVFAHIHVSISKHLSTYNQVDVVDVVLNAALRLMRYNIVSVYLVRVSGIAPMVPRTFWSPSVPQRFHTHVVDHS